jgi:hypothetical protein
MTRHQPAIIVEQHLVGDPAEVAERPLHTGKPALVALIAKRPNIERQRCSEPGGCVEYPQ